MLRSVKEGSSSSLVSLVLQLPSHTSIFRVSAVVGHQVACKPVRLQEGPVVPWHQMTKLLPVPLDVDEIPRFDFTTRALRHSQEIVTEISRLDF